MKVIYTEASQGSLEEIIDFLLQEQGWPVKKLLELREKLLDKADSLGRSYKLYQEEEYLSHLEKGYRRAIDGHYKIIYRVEGDCVYITDFFDTRQDPSKMKG